MRSCGRASTGWKTGNWPLVAVGLFDLALAAGGGPTISSCVRRLTRDYPLMAAGVAVFLVAHLVRSDELGRFDPLSRAAGFIRRR